MMNDMNMEMYESEPPVIMVTEVDTNLPRNGDMDSINLEETARPTSRTPKPKVTFAKIKRQPRERPEYGSFGQERSGTTLIAVALVVGFIALLLGFVGLSRTGSIYVDVTNEITSPQTTPTGTETPATEIPDTGDRVWTFAIGDYNNRLEYVELQSGQVKGFNIDVVSAVCRIAKKNCRLEWDDYNRCWESSAGDIEKQGGGIGLLGRWYDACTGWLVTYRRVRTFSFTDAHVKQHLAVFMVKTGTPDNAFNWRNLTGKTIGFLSYYSEDVDCVQRQTEIAGNDLSDGRALYYLSQQDLLAAVNNGEVDAVFISEFLGVKINLQLASDRIDRCSLQGDSMMMRKDSTLATWWNPALSALIDSSEYRQICKGLEDESIHGSVPGPAADAVCIGF